MKRFIAVFAVFVMFTGIAAAQNAKQRVEVIRKAYQQAQELIAQGKTELHARNEFTINGTWMMHGTGTTDTQTQFYFIKERYDAPPRLYMVRESFNVAARKFYREYLYDVNTGEPMFFYTKYDDFEKGRSIEERFYYKNRQAVHTIPDNLGEGFDWIRYFDKNRNLFNEYMSIHGN